MIAALALYLFVVHTLTAQATVHPPGALSSDRNFLTGNVLIFVIGIVLFATLALLPPLMQGLLGYSVLQAGLVTAPRGARHADCDVRSSAGWWVASTSRLIIGTGLVLTAISLWQMTHFSLQMDDVTDRLVGSPSRGFGIGIVYVPMAALTFATLPPAMRNEGTALFNLMRNVGSSIGISVVQALFVRNTQIVHASLAAHMHAVQALAHHSVGVSRHARRSLRSIRRSRAQAAMIAYLDDFLSDAAPDAAGAAFAAAGAPAARRRQPEVKTCRDGIGSACAAAWRRCCIVALVRLRGRTELRRRRAGQSEPLHGSAVAAAAERPIAPSTRPRA